MQVRATFAICGQPPTSTILHLLREELIVYALFIVIT